MPLSPEQREARRAARAGLVPPISYPEHLPVVDRRDDIAAAIRELAQTSGLVLRGQSIRWPQTGQTSA